MLGIFDVVPDPVSRAAMEETFAPGFCKIVLSDAYTPEPGISDDSFPPEPSEILAITAAYLRPGAPDGIKQEFISLSPSLPSTNAAVRLYRDSIDNRHRKMSSLLYVTKRVSDLTTAFDIRRFCITTVQRRERHLLAAHLIARVARTGALMDGLVMPTDVSEGIPMLIRNTLAPTAAQLPPDDPDLAFIRPLLRGDPTARESAAIATAQFLPRSSYLRRAIDDTREHRRRLR